MLVSNNVYKNRYVYDGAQFNFPISFPFLDEKHIQVRYAKRGQEDTDSHIMNPSYYMITGAGNPAGGVLTRLSNWEPGIVIVIIRDVPITQLHQYTQYDNFPAESHEDALAKLTMICQELDEICSRAITVPATSKKTPQEWWKAIYDEIMHARDQVLAGLTLAGNVTGATMVVADGTTTPRSISDRFADIINVKDFGAKGDGVTDDTDAIKSALIFGLSSGKTVYFPCGKYNFTRISIKGSGKLTIRGDRAELFSTVNDGAIQTGYGADYSLKFSGENIFTKKTLGQTLLATSKKFDKQVDWGIQKGDLILFGTNRCLTCGYRGTWTDGILMEVSSVDENIVNLDECVSMYLPKDEDIHGLIASSGTTTQIEFADINSTDMLYDITCTSGSNKGITRKISRWDNTKKIASFIVSSVGQKAWPHPISSGDVFTLQKRVTISCYRPISVEMSGLTVSRTLQTDAIAGAHGYFGPRVDFGRAKISNCRFTNFSETSFAFFYCYKPSITDCDFENANREYISSVNLTDGTGYGLLRIGCYGTFGSNLRFSGCRSGLNCGGMDALDIYGVFSNIQCFNGNVLNYTGEFELCSNGIGQHGNGWENTYSDIKIIGTTGIYAVSVSGHYTTFKNIEIHGPSKMGFTIGYNFGVDIIDCLFQSTLTDEHHFCQLWVKQYDNRKPIRFIRNTEKNCAFTFCSFYGINDGDLENLVIENLHFYDNTVFMSDNAQVFRGFFGLSPSVKVKNIFDNGNNHVFSDNTNILIYGWASGVGSSFTLADNGFVQVSNNSYIIKIINGSTLSIPLGNTTGLQTCISIYNGNSNEVCCNRVNLFDIVGNSTDLSPIGFNNKRNINILNSKSDFNLFEDGKLSIWKSRGNIFFHSTVQGLQTFCVSFDKI